MNTFGATFRVPGIRMVEGSRWSDVSLGSCANESPDLSSNVDED